MRQEARVSRHELGERPRVTTDAAGHAVHRIAFPKRRRILARRRHDARHVHAEDGGQRLTRVIANSGEDLRIERIDRAGHHLHQDFACARMGRGYLQKLERFALRLRERGLHQVGNACHGQTPRRSRQPRISAPISAACVSGAKCPVSSGREAMRQGRPEGPPRERRRRRRPISKNERRGCMESPLRP